MNEQTLPEPPNTEEDKALFTDDELDNLRVIKLINGEEIVAVILAAAPDYMLVRRPCKIVRIPSEDGKVAVILFKWQTFSDQDKHAIVTSGVLSYAKVNDSMLQFYLKSVLNQMEEEVRESVPEGFSWPDWMNEAIDTKKLN